MYIYIYFLHYSYGSKSSSVKTKSTSSFNARYPSQSTTYSSTQSNNKNLLQANTRSSNDTNVRNSTSMNNKSSTFNGKSPTSTNTRYANIIDLSLIKNVYVFEFYIILFFSFMYPPSTGTNVIPLTDQTVKPSQKVEKPNYMKTVNEDPRTIPTMVKKI